MKIIPTRHVAIIKPEKVDETTTGGLYLPESSRSRLQYSVDRGELVAIGDGFFESLPGPVPKIGDNVIFDKYAGSLVTIENDGNRQDYRLLNDDKIIGILEE